MKSRFRYDGSGDGRSTEAILVLAGKASTAPAGLAQSCASGQSDDDPGAGTDGEEWFGALLWLPAPGIAISHPGCVEGDSCRQISEPANGRSCNSNKRIPMDRTMAQR